VIRCAVASCAPSDRCRKAYATLRSCLPLFKTAAAHVLDFELLEGQLRTDRGWQGELWTSARVMPRPRYYAASQKFRLNFRKRSSPPPPFRPAPTIVCPSSFSIGPAFHNRSRAIATTRASPPPSRRRISPTVRQEPSSNSNIFLSKDREVLVRLDRIG
jgi:hypothetical protein